MVLCVSLKHPGGMTKHSKILQYINYRMRITIEDGRMFVGKFMAYDKHLNMVLGDCEEFRKVTIRNKAKGSNGVYKLH
jgi:small nuclear ribonucleoprotein B and B'